MSISTAPDIIPHPTHAPDPALPPPPDQRDARIEAHIVALAAAAGPQKSICPSEVARALHAGPGPDGWQSLLTPVRRAAIRLVQAGQIEILRKGRPVEAGAVRGVIRLRIVEGPTSTADVPRDAT